MRKKYPQRKQAQVSPIRPPRVRIVRGYAICKQICEYYLYLSWPMNTGRGETPLRLKIPHS